LTYLHFVPISRIRLAWREHQQRGFVPTPRTPTKLRALPHAFGRSVIRPEARVKPLIAVSTPDVFRLPRFFSRCSSVCWSSDTASLADRFQGCRAPRHAGTSTPEQDLRLPARRIHERVWSAPKAFDGLGGGSRKIFGRASAVLIVESTDTSGNREHAVSRAMMRRVTHQRQRFGLEKDAPDG